MFIFPCIQQRELLSHGVGSFSFTGSCQNCPPKYLYEFASLFAACKSLHGDTSLTKWGIIRFFNFFQSDECRIVSHCLFKLFLWTLVRSNIFLERYQPFSSFANYVSSASVVFLLGCLSFSNRFVKVLYLFWLLIFFIMTVVDIFLQVIASFFTLISICVCFKVVSFVRWFLFFTFC